VALAVWELVTTGKVTMPDGRKWLLDAGEWFEVVKWIYAQVDGPPKQSLELAGADGGALKVKHEYADNDVANILSILAGLGQIQPGAEDGGDSETQ